MEGKNSKKKRTVKMWASQLKEIADIGVDFLGNGDYQEYDANKETTITGKMPSVDREGDPVTTDKIANSMSPRNFFGSRMSNNHTIYKENDEKEFGIMMSESFKNAVADCIVEMIRDRGIIEKLRESKERN